MSTETTAAIQDSSRITALKRLRLLDTPPEEAFDRLTRLASRFLRVPIALVNLIDEDRQFFKSAIGMGDVRELPVGTGVCSYALTCRQPLVIEDARLDPRFSSNPIVTDYGLVAYIGIPLITFEGNVLGTFCIVDIEPRSWAKEDVETMAELAAAVMTEVELRLAAAALEQKAEVAETARAAADTAHQTIRELVEGLDAIVWEADAATWQFSFVSPRAEDSLGYPCERWLKEPGFWRTLIHPDDQERVTRECTAATVAGRDHEIEYRAIAADGRVVWVRDLVRVLCDPEQRPQRLRGVMTDVTAHKETLAALAESEGRYRSLTQDALGTSEVGTFVLDAEFRVAWANAAVERFFGLEPDEAIGADKRRLVRERVAPAIEDGQRFSRKVLRTYDDNSAVEEFECMVRAREGHPERWLAHWSRPIRVGLYAGGRIEHYYDITEQKRIEAALREAKEVAEEANRTKSEFLGVMSHELRTPLNAILGYADLLLAQTRGPITSGQEIQIERINEGGRHLLELIEEILTFARLEAGKEHIRLATANVAELIRNAVEMVRPVTERKNLEFSVDVPNEFIPIVTDTRKVRQILLNLLGNAVKFTDRGRVGVATRPDGDFVRIDVSDTGPGIPPDQIAAIWEPFRQGTSGSTRDKGGTGLGLSVSLQLAHLLGGDMEVDSTPGEGSTFTLRLPLCVPAGSD